ncbi:hypothetical protein RR48_04016 [Papilio machaon]|uniref:Secreted protein n=1 Tax=Papilio machaon TaxID=76193 RepID=A0A0N0PDT2_PAPMA|nr:hypothetical protein RR48_04016 [Papilio machaon]
MIVRLFSLLFVGILAVSVQNVVGNNDNEVQCMNHNRGSFIDVSVSTVEGRRAGVWRAVRTGGTITDQLSPSFAQQPSAGRSAQLSDSFIAPILSFPLIVNFK